MLETDQNQDQNQDQDQDQDQDQNQDQDQDQDQDQNQDQNQSQNQDLSQNQDQDQDQNQDQNQSQSQNQDLSQNQDQDQDQNQDQNQSQSQNQDQDQDLSQNQDQDQDQSQNQDQDLSQNQDQDQDQDQNQDQNQSQSQNQDQDQDLSQNQDQDQDQNNPQTRTSAAAFKAFLMKSSTKTNTNLYDHLTQVLLKIMDERPPDVVDVFEDISREVKRAQFVNKQSTLRDMSEDDPAVTLAEQQRSLFIFPEEQDQEDELLEPALPNLTEVGHYLEQIGVGLGRGELLKVYLALRQLVKTNALPRCRFWGKILGTESNYIIAEVEYREGEEEEDERSEEEVFGERDNEEKEDREVRDRIDIPQSTYKPPPVVPVEAPGTGTNKCVYYVSKEPGFPWTKLPSVTPAQITCARQIRKFFTGRLDAPIMSYPPFPGNEANYLRAQIARISAGTQVSPLGFYQFKEEEGFEEDERPQDSYEVNPEFEGISAAKLSKSLSLWVHHTQHILEQGRCTWVNLTIKAEELNDEEEEEKEEEPEEAEPEIGPPLLTTLSQDAELFHTPPWTLKISSSLTPEHAVAYVRSNLWPGAYAYAFGKKFENIYIGWGLKYTGGGYSPPVPHPPQREYPSGPEITEALDPTVEEEQALKDALEEQEAAKEEMEETDEEEDDD
ncbi:radial spoke head protein 6 homolog A-like [Eucyclogobius newberryi]|uniref:radial spoke head protein 6 homolog A-like n=1 Tax=Eucyclogobius newberryi TaxID=166745 RepID=UPI003B5C72A1